MTVRLERGVEMSIASEALSPRIAGFRCAALVYFHVY